MHYIQLGGFVGLVNTVVSPEHQFLQHFHFQATVLPLEAE